MLTWKGKAFPVAKDTLISGFACTTWKNLPMVLVFHPFPLFPVSCVYTLFCNICTRIKHYATIVCELALWIFIYMLAFMYVRMLDAECVTSSHITTV